MEVVEEGLQYLLNGIVLLCLDLGSPFGSCRINDSNGRGLGFGEGFRVYIGVIYPT